MRRPEKKRKKQPKFWKIGDITNAEVVNNIYIFLLRLNFITYSLTDTSFIQRRNVCLQMQENKVISRRLIENLLKLISHYSNHHHTTYEGPKEPIMRLALTHGCAPFPDMHPFQVEELNVSGHKTSFADYSEGTGEIKTYYRVNVYLCIA